MMEMGDLTPLSEAKSPNPPDTYKNMDDMSIEDR